MGFEDGRLETRATFILFKQKLLITCAQTVTVSEEDHALRDPIPRTQRLFVGRHRCNGLITVRSGNYV